jgi:hypothetical protein
MDYLNCPECDTPAIPASGWCRNSYGPTWTEDDQADCPGCGLALRAFLTGDANGEWMEAREVDDGETLARR